METVDSTVEENEWQMEFCGIELIQSRKNLNKIVVDKIKE